MKVGPRIYTLTFSDCVAPLTSKVVGSSGAPWTNSDDISKRATSQWASEGKKNISVSNPIRLWLGDNGSPLPVVCVLNPTFTSDASVALLPYTTEVDELF